jgi:predicted acylesterase/phospholipase RssA
MTQPRPHVSLVLSGGSARGLAHLGVLEVLEENGIPLHSIVGASYGSIMAGYYAYGYPLDDLHRMAGEFSLSSVIHLGRPWLQLLSNEKVRAVFEKDLKGARVENIERPVHITAIDILRDEPYVFDEGPLSTALLASSAFPGLLGPVRHGDRLLMDGGFLNDSLIRVARERGADVVIFSDVCMFSYLAQSALLRRLYGLYVRRVTKRSGRKSGRVDTPDANSGPLRLFRHAVKTVQKNRREPGETSLDADVLIEPVCGEIKPLHFGAVEHARHLGRCAAEDTLDRIRRVIERWTPEDVRADTTPPVSERKRQLS